MKRTVVAATRKEMNDIELQKEKLCTGGTWYTLFNRNIDLKLSVDTRH
jgi:hypothetical protein|tara:strand:+ start:506 stop:649 length:144 start_codon:yes stop_codon:yes gene_type:complete